MDLTLANAKALSTVDLLVAKITTALPAIGSGALVMAAFVLAAWVVRTLIGRVVPSDHPSAARLLGLLAGTVFWSLAIVGVICGLGTMGVNVGALIAGLGLTGFALGMAVKDAVANLVSGVLILLYRPFSYGSTIVVSGVAGGEGRVVSIDLRYTTLESETARVLVPNQTMFSNTVLVKHEAPGPAIGAGAARPAS